jgi:hypothetical protein
MDTEIKNLCIFCEKDLSNEKFREDYILIPWIDDPEDKNSFNREEKKTDITGNFITEVTFEMVWKYFWCWVMGKKVEHKNIPIKNLKK